MFLHTTSQHSTYLFLMTKLPKAKRTSFLESQNDTISLFSIRHQFDFIRLEILISKLRKGRVSSPFFLRLCLTCELQKTFQWFFFCMFLYSNYVHCFFCVSWTFSTFSIFFSAFFCGMSRHFWGLSVRIHSQSISFSWISPFHLQSH